jgi:hypothetical protein
MSKCFQLLAMADLLLAAARIGVAEASECVGT